MVSKTYFSPKCCFPLLYNIGHVLYVFTWILLDEFYVIIMWAFWRCVVLSALLMSSWQSVCVCVCVHPLFQREMDGITCN